MLFHGATPIFDNWHYYNNFLFNIYKDKCRSFHQSFHFRFNGLLLFFFLWKTKLYSNSVCISFRICYVVFLLYIYRHNHDFFVPCCILVLTLFSPRESNSNFGSQVYKILLEDGIFNYPNIFLILFPSPFHVFLAFPPNSYTCDNVCGLLNFMLLNITFNLIIELN